MARTKDFNPADYIEPLCINGLEGRMMRVPAKGKKKSREILFVYGHHASLERQGGLIQVLNRYGAVTMPDLPGFGGMDSLYKIGQKPTVDNLADYLATFIKWRYKRKRITIIGFSFGFAVTTRMLQKYPEVTKKVDILISAVGMVNHEEFKFRRRTRLLLGAGSRFFSGRLPATWARYVALHPFFIRRAYLSVADKHAKMKDASPAERDKRIEFEINLWHANDVRTYMFVGREMFKMDLCAQQVSLPVYHIAVEGDLYFDNHLVEQHLAVIYQKVTMVYAKLDKHAPTVVASAEEAAPMIPPLIRRVLARQD